MMETNSDYEIKKKNCEHERIFSYDKPNKFRSDVSNMIQVLTENKAVIGGIKEIAKKLRNLTNKVNG
jgi:hypothetical protein